MGENIMLKLQNKLFSYTSDGGFKFDVKVDIDDSDISNITVISETTGNPRFNGDLSELDEYIKMLTDIRDYVGNEDEDVTDEKVAIIQYNEQSEKV